MQAPDDVLVETFWRVHRGRARYDPSRTFGAWLRRIATNATLDHLRAARRLTDDERLQGLLRTALALPSGDHLARDLWPEVVERTQRRPGWTWIDLTVAAVVATALLLFPESVFVLSYHL